MLFFTSTVGSIYKKNCLIRLKEETGVWCDDGKFASLGMRISKGILLHGLCINGYRTEQSFLGIRPCGLDAPPSFLLPEKDVSKFLKLGEQILKTTQEKMDNLAHYE